MSELREAFERFDTDGSGTIEVDELDALLGALDLDTSNDVVLVALAKLQTADPSKVTWNELESWWSTNEARIAKSASEPAVRPGEDERLRHLFDRFDADGDGSIDVGEFKQLLTAAGRPPDTDGVFAAMQSVDADGSGTLSWEEFRRWWSKTT